jgi:hypothetical protein
MDDTLVDWSAREQDWGAHTQRCLRPVYEHLVSQGHAIPSLDHVTQTYGEHLRQVWDAVSEPDWLPRQIDVLRNTLRS